MPQPIKGVPDEGRSATPVFPWVAPFKFPLDTWVQADTIE